MKPVIKFTNSILMLSLLIGCGGGSDKEKPVVKPKPVNQAPIAVDDVVTLLQDQQVNIDVLNNDNDPENDPLTITGVTVIEGGIPTISNNEIQFVPEIGFSGEAQFSYSITDGSKASQAKVYITVTASLTQKQIIEKLKTQVDEFNQKWIDWFESEQIDCALASPHPDCEPSIISFSDGQFDPDKTDNKQTILVMDSGLAFSAITRYRSRIKAFYSYDVALQ
ncbi:Ig-like domain-containing protein, partial [Pseudoalteromonas denitrificans]